MTDALAAWSQLVDAMEDTDPNCLDEPLFTFDRPTVHRLERKYLRALCADCPLLEPCRTYAAIARPPGGLWAGKYYTPTAWDKHTERTTT